MVKRTRSPSGRAWGNTWVTSPRSTSSTVNSRGSAPETAAGTLQSPVFQRGVKTIVPSALQAGTVLQGTVTDFARRSTHHRHDMQPVIRR